MQLTPKLTSCSPDAMASREGIAPGPAKQAPRNSSPAPRPAKAAAQTPPVDVNTSTPEVGKAHAKASFTSLSGPASAVCYVLASLVMTSMTKHAASAWRFPGSSVLLLIECLATVAALAVMPHKEAYRPFSGPILRHLPLVTLSKALNMYLSFVAMKRTSLPVYNALKRLQPVYAMVQDWLIRGNVPVGGEMLGVVLISVGTLVASIGDLEFDLQGYALALIAAGCQSLYLVLARRAQDEVPGLSSMDLLFYTAFFNSALFLPLSAMELDDVRSFLSGPGELMRLAQFLLPYVILGAFLNYATFWCTSANSPLATAVAGNAKGVLSTLVGVVWFSARLTTVGWAGVVGSMLGGFVYSVAQATKPKPKKPDDKAGKNR
eukprot:TRINITY_DN20885_c0_g1_i1.p1 TRINITY_DN20885_c0_g1~~TRINITY_DN20885_c0_g1_i1.p1  ORF type:complete len:377 (-),score=54.16 TRINITY_DN20885_c0_g1_i1:77-1207(-)